MISAEYIASAVSLEGLPKTKRPQVAMVGRSNVGKSSLINHLVQQKSLARVSSQPGRTQTINLYEINKKYYLVDLPGYGFAKKSVEQREAFAQLILKYLEDCKQLALVVLIIDARIQLSALDIEMADWLYRERKPFVIVLNKADKVNSTDMQKLRLQLVDKYPNITLLEHSVKYEDGRREILATFERAVKNAK